MTEANLFAQQEANLQRSKWLVIGFVVFFAWVGFGGDVVLGMYGRSGGLGGYHHRFPWLGLVSTLLAGGMTWHAWKSGAQRVLNSTGAYELITPGTPEQQRLVNVVEEMAIASGMPRPKIWIVPDQDPNAFATGRDPLSGNIAVTEGLLALLNREELQGVVAHEMAHIRNFDTRLMTLLAAMIGAMALMSDGFGRTMRFGRIGGGSSSSRSSSDRGGNPLAPLLLGLWVISLILAPIISRFLAMAVSRKREFLADATAAQFTRNPLALAAALEKLEAAADPTRSIGKGAEHLCVVDPADRHFADREGLVGDVFASHPPIRKRIAMLRGMGYQQEKREAAAAT